MSKLFRRLKSDVYQYQLTHLVDEIRLALLENECLKEGTFTTFDDKKPMDPDKLYCFFNKNEEVGTPMPMDTCYFFYNNTCIVYSHKGLDKIVRVRVKSPDEAWSTSTKYAEIYDWWDVDWMGVNRRDSNISVKSGAWNRMVYKDIRMIYDTMSGRKMETKMDEIYQRYEKENRK